MRGWFVALLVVMLVGAVCPVRALTPPVATYGVRARVMSAVDDELEGISFLRVRLNVVGVTSRPTTAEAPTLGAGTTVTAMVREPADRATLRSASPTLELGLQLGWFGAQSYEVLSLDDRLDGESAGIETNASSDQHRLLLLALLIVLSAAALAGLTHYHHRSHVRR